MATADEQIADMQAGADVVVVLSDLLRRARRGELRHVAVAVEAMDGTHTATIHSTLKARDRMRLIGLVTEALDRIVRGP